MTTGAPGSDTPKTAPEDVPAAVLSHSLMPSARIAGLVVLTKRSDFVRASHAFRAGASGLNLQGRIRSETEGAGQGVRVGFTCSKKVGNAVARNRAKRRLREIARLILPQIGRPGWDYVIIGKNAATAARPFVGLQDDLRSALRRVHTQAGGAQAGGAQ